MRVLVLLAVVASVLSTSCARQPSGNSADAASESAKSPPAIQAQALARRYMKLISARDYAAARAMWGHGGADVGGSAEDFARTFAQYSRYEGQVGDPTEIKKDAGEEFVAVSATVNATLQKTGEKKVLAALIRFRRPIQGGDKDPNHGQWAIWAVDLRKPH